jgi:hypothetical protein
MPKFYEFIMHIKEDIVLSLLSFSKICRLNEQELRIISYMKDVVLYEVIPKKIKFINLGVVVYLLQISKFFEWTSTNTKTIWFSSSLVISSHDSGDAMA